MAQLHYHIEDGQDGSVSIEFYLTEAEATKAAEDERENYDGGLEGNTGFVNVGMDVDGKLVLVK